MGIPSAVESSWFQLVVASFMGTSACLHQVDYFNVIDRLSLKAEHPRQRALFFY